MTNKKLIWIIVLSFIVGGIVGYLVTTKTFGRYNALNATCTTLNAAVENQMLTSEQVLELGSLTKDKLGDSQAAQYFKADKKHLENASSDSNCSQFIVGMSQ
ncbi:hypothetical protein [uncultured Psychrobacter sp.]|uniref:hypothetical protein n=1 Tax=uncultured Psychrobacter sp. TaxID=259303 RepID=UPI00263046D0|nr:hypothetical protein [uncultured Psychrobacter sp.]